MGRNRVWVILQDLHPFDPKGLIVKSLSESFKLSYYKEYFRIKLYEFERNK